MSFATIRFISNFSTVKMMLIKNVTVFGGGLMGSGIAQVAAQTGHNVILVDINDEVLNASKSRIKNSLNRVSKKLHSNDKMAAEKFVSDSLAHLTYKTDVEGSVKDCDLAVEAIIENMDLKHQLFSKIDQLAPQKTIFATNTSSFLVQDVSSTTKRLDRFGGLHFFNPVPVMKLVEVIRTPKTSQETHDALMKFGTDMGKTVVEAKDSPGFIVNRLLVPFLMESIKMIERGDATAKDIDNAMKLGLGHPMGPIELCDYTGLDTCKFIMDGWQKKYPNNPRFEGCQLLNDLVSEGKLGIKTGEGFYKYNK